MCTYVCTHMFTHIKSKFCEVYDFLEIIVQSKVSHVWAGSVAVSRVLARFTQSPGFQLQQCIKLDVVAHAFNPSIHR